MCALRFTVQLTYPKKVDEITRGWSSGGIRGFIFENYYIIVRDQLGTVQMLLYVLKRDWNFSTSFCNGSRYDKVTYRSGIATRVVSGFQSSAFGLAILRVLNSTFEVDRGWNVKKRLRQFRKTPHL